MNEVLAAFSVFTVGCTISYIFGVTSYSGDISDKFTVIEIKQDTFNKNCNYTVATKVNSKIISPLDMTYNLVAECGLYGIDDQLQLVKKK